MTESTKNQDKLSPLIEGKFECTERCTPGIILHPVHGEIDLRTISLEMAEKLVNEGWPYLRKKANTAPPKTA